MAKILVVDDEESDRVLIGGMLIYGGHEAIYATDGREALHALNRDPEIRAVVTDLRMPFLNGLRLIRDRRQAGDSIPIIAISGVNADQLLLAEDYGASGTLTKPVERDRLLRAVKDALEGLKSDWEGVWITIHPELGWLDDG